MDKQRSDEINKSLEALWVQIEQLSGQAEALELEQAILLSAEFSAALGVFSDKTPTECIIYHNLPIMVKLFFDSMDFERSFIALIDNVKWTNDVRITLEGYKYVVVYGELSKVTAFAKLIESKVMLSVLITEVTAYRDTVAATLQSVASALVFIDSTVSA